VSIAFNVTAVLAQQWFGLFIAISTQLALLASDNWWRLRKERQDNRTRNLAFESLLDGLQKHTDLEYTKRESTYLVARDGTTVHDHEFTVRTTGDRPCRFIELGAKGNLLEERRRSAIEFQVTDSAGLPTSNVARWSDSQTVPAQSVASIIVVFDQPIAAGDEASFRLRYEWPRQNPEIGDGEECKFEFKVTTPTTIWDCSLIIHPGAVKKATSKADRASEWRAKVIGDGSSDVAQSQDAHGGRVLKWTMEGLTNGDICTLRVQAPES